MKDIEKLNYRPFTRFCMSIGAVPSSYLAGLSIEEQLLWLCSYLEKEVIPAVNNNGEAVEELQNLYVQLHDYVEHYFDNLDVQTEINNKLDVMADDGTLAEIINQEIFGEIQTELTNLDNKIDTTKFNIESDVDSELTAFRTETNATIDSFESQTNATIATQNQNIEDATSQIDSTLANMQTQINALQTGSPLVASSTGGMTDTSRIYVNTTDGKWYYYDGDSWEIGGTYQSSGIGASSVTLNMLGNDVTYNLNSRINDKDFFVFEQGKNIVLSNNLLQKNVNQYGEIGDDSTTTVITNNLIYIPHNADIEIPKNTNNYQIEVFFYDKDGNWLSDSLLNKRRIDNTKYIFNTFSSNYIRIRFTKGTGITISDVTSTVEMKFVPNILLDKPEFEVGTNLLNYSKTKSGYLDKDTKPYDLLTSGSYLTSLIPIKKDTTYFVSSFRKKAIYDENLLYVANSFINAATTNHSFTAAIDGYMAISYNTTNVFVCEGSSGTFTPYIESLPAYMQIQNVSNLSEIIAANDVLFGKKYVALGDSFTHGDFTSSPTDDYTFESGTYQGEYKVYPFIIGDRNDMTIVNLAVNGMTITNVGGSSTNYLSDSVLANIPADTDYITIKIGINDNHQNAPIGEITDNVSTSFYGSWNRVMNYLVTNYPEAKIGIIVSNGITNINYVNATIAIAKKYGVAYINESTDDRVPLLIRTLRSNVLDSVKTARDTDWEVNPPTNQHPNVKCHEYESTIIENFLRTL